MKTNSDRNLYVRRGETTFLDVIAVIAAIGLVAAVAFAYAYRNDAYRNKRIPSKAQQINCYFNLQQITLAFRLWAGDNDDKYPMQVSTNEGGTMEFVASGTAFPHFVALSNELSGRPKVLTCLWYDTQRTPATNFANLTETNISYFLVPEADETLPEMWLCGDRNLATNNAALKPGLFTLTSNRVMRWTDDMHSRQGNLGLVDGSVHEMHNASLQRSAATALRAYHKATTNISFRIAIP